MLNKLNYQISKRCLVPPNPGDRYCPLKLSNFEIYARFGVELFCKPESHPLLRYTREYDLLSFTYNYVWVIVQMMKQAVATIAPCKWRVRSPIAMLVMLVHHVLPHSLSDVINFSLITSSIVIEAAHWAFIVWKLENRGSLIWGDAIYFDYRQF